MAKPITKGFSLVETLIATTLLAMLSITLIQTTVSLNDVNKNSEQIIQDVWQRKNFIAHRDLVIVDQYLNPVDVQSTTHSFVDTNNDGIADTWSEVQNNTAPALVKKTVTKVLYANGAIDHMISTPD